MFENVPAGKSSQLINMSTSYLCVQSIRLFTCLHVFVLSVLSGAAAGSGSSGASAGQTGPEGGVDPQ